MELQLHGSCTQMTLISLAIEIGPPETFVSVDIDQTFLIHEEHEDLETFYNINEDELGAATPEVATIDWVSTTNVHVDGSVFTWTDMSQNGMVLHQFPLKRLSFRIKDMVLANSLVDFHEIKFALVDAHSFSLELWPLIGHITQVAKIAIDGISAGLEFSIEMKDGKVDMCVDSEHQTLLRVNKQRLYYPILLFSGSIRQLEVISNEMIPCFGIDKSKTSTVLTKLLRPLSIAGHQNDNIRRARSCEN